MLKKEKPILSVTAIIQGAQQHWGRVSGLGGMDSNSAISLAPQSPMEIKPDTATLLSSGNFSPTGGGGPNSPGSFSISGHSGMINSPAGSQSKSPSPYPPNHPLSGSKHLCSICGDRASGKHYGVYSCEGCKGFFKRTVRKDLSYACREDKNCIIDKRQRNRCQYCRYQKCLMRGMKREAVQEERQRTKERDQVEVESTSTMHSDLSAIRLLEAELRSLDFKPTSPQPKLGLLLLRDFNPISAAPPQIMREVVRSLKRSISQTIHWAKTTPLFAGLPIQDQTKLIITGFVELVIAAISFRSVDVKDVMLLSNEVVLHRSCTNAAGVISLYDRIVCELINKMRDMRIDKTEYTCLRTVVLFNPEVRGLKSAQEVEKIREKIYSILEEYTRANHPNEPGRFAKLLLRLPALRSIGLKSLEHLFYVKMVNSNPYETKINQMIDAWADPDSPIFNIVSGDDVSWWNYFTGYNTDDGDNVPTLRED